MREALQPLGENRLIVLYVGGIASGLSRHRHDNDEQILGAMRKLAENDTDMILACAQLRLRALALGDLFGGNIDTRNLSVRPAHRMPIGYPGALADLVWTLTGNLDANDGLARFHD